MKVYVKIWCMFLVLTLLLAGAGLGISWTMKNQYNEDLKEQFRSQVMAAADLFEQQMSDVDTQVLTTSVSVSANLFGLYQPERDWARIYEKSDLLHQQLKMLQQSYPYIHRAYLLFPTLGRQITNSVRYDHLDWDFYENMLAQGQSLCVENNSLLLFFMVSSNVVNQNGAIAGVEIAIDPLIEHCAGSLIPQMEVGICIDGVMAAPWPYGGWTEHEKWTPVDNGFVMAAPVNLHTRRIPIELIVYLPQAQLQSLSEISIVWNVLLMVLIALELLVFAWLLSRIIARPLRQLLDGFDAVAQGNMKVRIHQDTGDEFADIYHHFNTSVEKLDTLLTQEYQARMAAQHAEIKHLQAQVQPHFLYNSFYQMYRICRMEECHEAAQFALLLSGYYEYITRTDSRNNIVSLADELEHTRKYIDIQQFRYGDRLSVSFQVSQDVVGIEVPKLILQPVVENAVKYCVENDTTSQLTIRISVVSDAEKIKLLIEDNGQTLSDEDIEQQNKRIETANSSVTGSGLINLHLRLKLAGHKEGVRLSRSALGGLCVCLTLNG